MIACWGMTAVDCSFSTTLWRMTFLHHLARAARRPNEDGPAENRAVKLTEGTEMKEETREPGGSYNAGRGRRKVRDDRRECGLGRS
jgi:hypothetical protein